jgi:hypothetical protein
MVEPVLPAISSAVLEAPPRRSSLVRPFEDAAAPAFATEAPSPGDPGRTHAPGVDTVHSHVAGGGAPARPAFPDHPMNESVVEPVQTTVPATDRADHPPAPPPPTARPKLVVLRGARIGAEYPVYEGRNTVGRFADKPVDIDLVSQETTEQIWCSRQHAVVLFERGSVSIEDLNSLNGTWVNGARIHAGQLRTLRSGDVVQIGTVQMKLVIG